MSKVVIIAFTVWLLAAAVKGNTNLAEHDYEFGRHHTIQFEENR